LWFGTKLTAVESFGSRAKGLESSPLLACQPFGARGAIKKKEEKTINGAAISARKVNKIDIAQMWR
jgi:hypothetical protein